MFELIWDHLLCFYYFQTFYWHRAVMIFRSLQPYIFSISWLFYIKCLIQYSGFMSTCTISTTKGKQILNDKNNEEDSRIFNIIRFHLFKVDFTYSNHFNYWIKTAYIPTLQHKYFMQTSHQHAFSKCRAMIYKSFHLNTFCLFG